MGETIRRVIALFQGHPELIEGYAAFLPPGNTIRIPADPHGNILVTMAAVTMEMARDGTTINETSTQAPEPQGAETKLPSELAERDRRLLEILQARIPDSDEYKTKYEVFRASFEAYLKMPPEQRKACSTITPSKAFCTYSCPRLRLVPIRVTSSWGSSRIFSGMMMSSRRYCLKFRPGRDESPFE